MWRTANRCRPIPTNRSNLARRIGILKLKYVVITSVDRDDLRDGGAQHFADCLSAIRAASPRTKLETLVPDFRGRLDIALDALAAALPDVLNHNLETVPRLYSAGAPRRRLRAFAQAAQGIQGALPARDDQIRPDAGPGRDR